ncbi:MAG: hypothetical protein VX130_03045 [Verrucomicrobiota bacterium]|nr:hypothetical protein [Verrucomicrobiota bacterium]
MTELPLDTLLIIGLVIASFVGKFFQKKEGTPSSKPKPIEKEVSAEGESLEDVLKEAWKRATQPEDADREVASPPVPVEIEEEEEFAPPPIVSSQEDKDHYSLPVSKVSIDEAWAQTKSKQNVGISDENFSNSSTYWLKDSLSGGSQNLKKAFVLKEILDKPKSLKSFTS